ncbi:MAG: site-2 protease family protein [Acidobacteriota bacterium]|nr:site-2 protease family protein [Blastocatellia bacterium]MDW8241421.1 site-2 protease family protein [Acidobacteriota bacterium]
MSDQPVVPAATVEPPVPAAKLTSELSAKRLLLHVALFLLTLLSCFFIGAVLSLRTEPNVDDWWSLLLYLINDPYSAASGAAYALVLISILLAHELGHYFACRYYGIRATLPYFIPAPTLIGTFGAFIRIKEPIRSRRALFDIGIAGPLAGFVVAIPAVIVGLWIATPAEPLPPDAQTSRYIFQDPLLFQMIQRWLNLPTLMEWNPIYFAAWVGMLATGLNLLPVGQLDGGHVVYALFGRRGHRWVATGIFAIICVLAWLSYRVHRWPGWFVYVALLGLMLGLQHPPVEDEQRPLDRQRYLIGMVGLIVFILSFMPFPIVVE